jgi:GT2 family glycosyltransferase
MSKCYVIILNYKRWEDSVECLRALFNSTYQDFTAIVIDNCSGNDSLEHITAALMANPLKKSSRGSVTAPCMTDKQSLAQKPVQDWPDLVLVQNDTNAGFAAGNNVILELLKNEDAYIWLLNPDMVADIHTMEEMIKASRENEQAVIGAVTMNFYLPEEVLFYGGGKVNFFSGTVSPINSEQMLGQLEYISGGCLLMRTNHLRKVGLLPDHYFLYWEETDWCYEAKRKGFPMQVSLRATCYDKISTSIGRGFLSDYFYTRNGLLFLKKYGKAFVPVAIVMTFFRMIKRVMVGQMARAKGMMRGVIDFLTNKQYGNQ